MDKLNAAIAERIKYQGRTVRTFAQIVNTALWSVAVAAQRDTPKADVGKIRSSAFVTVNYVVDKRTGKLKPGRKGNRFNFAESISPNDFNNPAAAGLDDNLKSHASLELMFAVVLARANLSKIGRLTGTSLYNLKTNSAWTLDKSKLTSRAVIKAIAERMISARSSSTSLLKAGWKPAIDILGPFIAKNDIGGNRPERLDGANKNVNRLGTAIPAREGWFCWGMIENHVGHGGTKLDPLQQRALLQYGTVPFQRALSTEADKMYAKIKEWQERDAVAFNRAVR